MAESLVRRLEAGARRWPERRALIWEGGALTHGELDALAVAAAARLAARGVGPGARLALVIPNRWPFAVALLAGWKLGATVVPLDPRLAGEERRAILADLAPALMVEEVDVGTAPQTQREALRAPAPGDLRVGSRRLSDRRRRRTLPERQSGGLLSARRPRSGSPGEPGRGLHGPRL